ncbi:MAG TPA: hypothetical protein VLC09_17660, partial [Polyangiaceae bacterium]|nr:hypothetical protein [Polyangiaceae bacterium]
MLVSYRWLQELLPELDREPREIADALSAVGLAVDGIADYECALRPLLIVEVLEVAPHPARPALQLVTVRTRADDAGAPPSGPRGSLAPVPERELPARVTVVCGASNVPAPGGLVVLAGLGAKLPGVDFVLTRRDIGGVFSEGMLCS